MTKKLEDMPRAELKDELAKANAVMQWCLKSESARSINAMLDLARSEPGIPILPEEFDRDPWLFNCPNGTLELKTGTLREHRRADYLTKLCPVEYHADARCPRWLEFLDQIFARKTKLIWYVQRLLGYCLTGAVTEQILPILWGSGANGKSTLVNVVLEILGEDYALKAPRDLLMALRGDSHPTGLARLFGRRVAVCVESSKGGRLDEALVKELTGSDPITARRMREDYWTFQPQHKVFLVTNHRPVIEGTDHAIWRRIRLIPFEVVIADEHQDKQLPERLRGEYPGILAWMVEGCLAWQRDGLGMPEEVKEATASYRSSEDVIGAFLTERCVQGPDYCVRASVLRAAYCGWCEQTGEDPVSQRVLGESLTERGFKRRTSNGTWYRGLDLTTNG
jgi:putative DNA primase/helicase